MIYVDIFPPPKKKKKKPKKNKSKRLRDTCTSCTAYHLSWRYHFHEVLCVWRQWYYSDLIKLSLFFEYFSYLLLDFLCFGFSSKKKKKNIPNVSATTWSSSSLTCWLSYALGLVVASSSEQSVLYVFRNDVSLLNMITHQKASTEHNRTADRQMNWRKLIIIIIIINNNNNNIAMEI